MSKNPFDDPNFGSNFLSDTEKQSQAQAPAPAQAQTAAHPSGFKPRSSNPYDDPNYGAEPEGRTWGEAAKDTGAAVMQGFATLGGDLAWMADKATGGVVDIGFQKAADRATEYWQDKKSDQMKASNQALAEADGFTGTLKTAWDRPEVVPDILASSLPYMLPTGIAGRVAGAAKGAKAATAATIGTGGLLEGANAGRETEGKVLDMTAEKLSEVSPQYLQLIQSGMSHEDAAAQIANRAGLTAAAVSAPLAMLASKVTGAGKLEADFFTGKGLKGFFDTVLRESAEEMAQEASNPFGSNVGIKTQVNPDQSLAEGVPEGAALGLIAGAGQGVPMSALQNFVPPAKVQPTPTQDNPDPEPVERPDPSNGPISAAAAQMAPVQTAADLGVQFPEQQDWSQYERPTVQRQQEGQPARANDAVTNMVMQARQMGDSDAEVRLETANRLYRTIDRLMKEGNEEQARWNAYRADQIIREVSPRLPQAQQAEGAQTAVSTPPALITDDGVDLRDLAAQGQERAIGTAAEEAAKNQLIRKTVDDQTFAIGKVNQRSEYYSKLADLAQSLPQGTKMVDASTSEAWSVQASDGGITLTNDATGQTATLQQNETGTWTRTGEVLPPTEFKLRGNLAPVEQAGAQSQADTVAPQQGDMMPAPRKPQPVQKNRIEKALDRLTSEGATGPEINQQIAELERIQAGIESGRTNEGAVLDYLDRNQRYDMVRAIDPDAIKLNSKSQPFATEEAAKKSMPFQQNKKLASVVPYGDGFAVRIDTRAQREAEAEALRKKEERSRRGKEQYNRPIDPNRDDLLTAIALAGGINRKHAVEQGIDPAMLNIRGNHNAPVFTIEGDTADGMAQTLGQYGYINADSNREQDLLNKLMRAVNGGQRIMTPDGIIAEAEAAAAKEAEFQEAEEAGETVESVVADYIVEAREAGVPEDTIQSILESNKDNAVIAAVDLQHEAQILQNASVRSEEGNSTGRPEDEVSLDGGQPFTPELAAEIFGEPEPLLTSYTEQDLRDRENQTQAQQQADNVAGSKADADAQVGGFGLTGSNRPADIAAANGQQGLLGAKPEADPNTVTANWKVIGENLQGHEVSENTVTGLRSWRSNSGANTEQGRFDSSNTYETATEVVVRNRRTQYKTRQEIEAENAANKPKAGNAQSETIDGYPVVYHTTRKGRDLRGFIRTDINRQEAARIDKGTFKKDGGWFIRDNRWEEYKDTQAAKPSEQTPQSTERQPVSTEQPATTAEQNDTKPKTKMLGKNKNGKLLYEDENGVRFYNDSGVRIQETVQIIPGQGSVVNINKRPGSEFETQAEIAEREGGNELPQQAELTEQGLIDQAVERVIADETAMAQIQNNDRDTVLKNGNMRDIAGSVLVDALMAVNVETDNSSATIVRDLIQSDIDSDGFVARVYDAVQERQGGSRPEPKPQPKPKPKPSTKLDAAQEAIKKKRDQPQAENQKPQVSENTIFTEDAAEEARRILMASLGQVNSGIDPKVMQAGITLAGYHIEKGARTFAAYAKAMTNDLGEMVKPYLKSWYMGVKYDPRAAGFDGMDDAATVDAADIDALLSAPATLETEANSQEVGDGTTESEMDQPDQNGVSATAEGRGGFTQPSSTQTDTQDLAGTEPGNVEPTASGETDGGAGVRAATENVADDGRTGGSGVSTNGRPRTGGSRTPDAGTGSGSAAEGGRPTGGNAAPKPGVKDPASTSPAYTGPGNYHIDNPLDVVGGGQVARFNKNKQAIELFNDIRDNGRTATREEQDILAGYTGWGSFGQELFQGTWNNPKPKAGWEARDAWLREQLGQAEWESMQRSITNAHYTDPPTVMAMWDMVKRMGFEGGRVLEPSMGIGNFYGMMPLELKNRSQLSGIELDMMTGGMAQMLYPNANIKIMGYQESKTPDDFYDVIIGNWPFENTAIADRRYNKFNPMLHDYFFLKTLDQVRPGGIVIGITSKGSMDKKDSKIRSELAKKAELVASFRLPSGAFEEYAGTKVVTDIIILKKRAEPLGMAANEGWIKSVPYMTPQGQEVFINEYYASHPDHVIGTIEYGHGTTFNRPGMIVTRPNNMAEQLQRIVNMVPQGVFESRRVDNDVAYITNHTADREGSLTQQDGKLYVVRGEHLAPAEQVVKYSVKSEKTTAEREQQLRDLIGIRQAYAQLIEAENGLSGSDPEPLRKELRKQYNAFTKANGPLNASWGLQYLKRIDDPFRPALAALESERNGKTVPAAILERSTIRTPRTIDNPTVREAFVLARNESVNPTLDKIAELSGKPAEEVKTELIDSGAVFELPGGDIAPSDIYLSGNVREKMRQAVAALEEGNAAMQHNIDELQKVMPKDVPYFNIEAQLGASWVPTAVYEEYVSHMLDANSTEDIRVTYAGGKWKVDIASRLYLNTAGSTGFGTPRYNFKKLVNAAFGNQTVTIKAKDSDGNEFVDEEGSAEVNGKISDMRAKFKEWLWQDPDRRLKVEREYNEVRNAYATPRFDGSFLRFDGMALTLGTGPFNLRQHQADAIWRALVTRRSLNAHEVGTGKTFTMGGIAVESRRYGIAKKPLILAHNANSASVAHEIEMMYPAAKVLYIDNLDPKSIERKMRQIANDDWDAVVLPHSQLSKLALREDTLMAMAQDDIAELERQAIEAAEEDGMALDVDMMDALLDGDKTALKKVRSPTAKDLVKMRNRVIETIRKQGQKASKANAISFEELGVDMLLVDEAHVFKKPPFATRMKMKGLNTQASDASIALNFLARYVRANNNGGNIHLFTGTPVTNTLTEVFHMMRYIMNEEMQQQDLDQWDGWFNSFASEVMDIELNGAGEYEPVTRLAGFINVPELRKMIGQYMDTVFADDMPEMQPRKTASGKTLSSPDLTELERADLLNGRTEGAKDRPYKKVINESSDLSSEQTAVFNEVKRNAQAFRNMTALERRQVMQNGGPESPLLYEQMANKASFDVRLVRGEELAGQEGKVPDHPDSKASRAIRNMMEIYNSDSRATQVVFSEMGISKKGSRSVGEPGEKQTITFPVFSTIHDMIERLVQAGVPREQIALVDGSTSKEKRKEIAEKMNRSEIRIVFGSTASLGVGVNMQRNLRAMHHLDAPWMPGDLEQRNGRGHRQGNQWNTVMEYRYLTDRIDGRRWQVLAVKQRFINAFLKANEDSRIIEGDAASDDGSDILESFSEAAGDPRILIRKKMESKLEQMRQRRRLHDQGMVDAKNRVAGQREKLRRNQRIVKQYEDYDVVEKSKQVVESNAGANFTMKIGDQTVTDRKTAQELIDAFIAENVRMDGLYQEIGEFGGEQVLVGLENGASVPYLKMRFGIIEAKSNSQKVITLENALRGLPKAYDDLVAENAETEQNIQRLIQVSNEPFSQEKELQRMEQDLAALEQDIQDNPVAPPVWLRNGAPLETEVQWKGKPFEVTGHRWNSEGWFVLAKDASGSVVIPYTEVTDNQGMPLYEEREFESPDVVTRDQDQSGDDAIIKDTPQFSRSTTSVTGTPLSVADLDTVFNRIAPRLKNGQGYRIFENVRDLFAAYPAIEQHAHKQGSNGSDIEGVFHKGEILVVRNKITSEAKAEALIFHEGTHGGIKAMFADEGVSRAMNRLFMAMGGAQGFNRALDELDLRGKLQSYIKGTLEKDKQGNPKFTREERNAILVNELLAFTGEKNSQGIRQKARELVGAIRQFFRKLGYLKLSEVSVAELSYLARQARQQGLGNRSLATRFVTVDAVQFSMTQDQTETVNNDEIGAMFRRSDDAEPELSATLRAQQTLGNNDRNVWDKVKRTFKRNFTAAGLLPDSVFREKVLRDSEVNAHEFDTAHYIGALDRAISKEYGTPYRKLTDAQREAIDAQMKSTEPDMSIPEPVRVALMDMRRSITGLSVQYAEILQQQVEELQAQGNDADAMEKAALLETIISNMDTYAHRSYRAFDDPDWPAKVSKDPEIWPQAVAYLQQQYEGQGMTADQAEQRAIRTARTILEEGTAYEDMSSFIKESKLGSKDLSTLKRRKDIAPEIRALLGEYKDVKINYAKTLAKMSRLVANTKLLDRIKEIGLAEGWLFTEDNKPLNQSVTKVAGDASEVYAPLNGYYVPNEINQALIDTLGKEQMADWLRAVIRMNGMVKYGKTVLSPTTAFRNWMSAAFFAMANGHFDITQMRKSISGFSEYFGHGENPEKVAYLRKLKELGVVYDTAYAGEMMDLLADAKGGWAERLFENPGLSSLKAANELAQKFYQYGDDFWKIMGFENEKAMLMKHKGMSEAEAEVEAAERIRNTYPTYSMTGRAVNWLRRFPLAGTFVSFPAEVIRTQFHMLRYLKQDWKDSPAYAARKVVGLAMVSGLAYAAQALSKDLFDIGDDEEEAVRLLAASWNSNSNIWFMGRDEKGSIRYLDFSFLDPYNYFKRPINAVMRDQPLDKAVIQAAGEILTPFFGTDIAFGAISEIWNNKKEGGGRVYNPQDMALDQAQSIASHLRKAIQPGFVGNLERAWMAANDQVTASGKQYKAEEELAAFFGFRASTFDPKTALYYNSFEFKDRKRDATAVLMNVAKDPNSVSDSDLMRAYDTASRARLRAYTDMIRLVQAARAAGMNNMQLNASLRRSGISKADIRALMQGRIPAWRPDQRMMRNTIRKAELLYGPEVVREMRERERAIIQRGYRD